MIVHSWNSSPLRSNLLRLQCTCSTVPTTSGRPYETPLAWACQWPSSQPLSSPQLSHNNSLWAEGISKSHGEQGLDYREGEQLSWCPSWSNSLWQGWSCGLVHSPGENVTDPIWRVLASSQEISSWSPLKPQHSNPKSNPLTNQLWCIDFLTPPTTSHLPSQTPWLPWIYYATQKLKLDSCKMHKSSLNHSIRFCGIFFPSLKQNFIAYCSSDVSSRPDCIFEIHLLWQLGFSWVYSSCCCSCWFEPKIIKIGQSSHTMYNNNIVNFHVSTTISNAHTKKVWKLIVHTSYIVDFSFLAMGKR